jgi:hypothetical protein
MKQRINFLKLRNMKAKNLIQRLVASTSMIFISIVAFAQPLSLQISATNPTCSGLNTGEIVIDIQGGTLPYFVNGVEVNTSQIVEPNMAEGYYMYCVTDGAGSTATSTISLVAPPALGVQAIVNNVTTFGGSNGAVNVTVSNPAVTYFWYTEDGSGIVSGQEDQVTLSKGLYSLIITETNGCTTFRRYTINQPTNPATFFNSSLTPSTQGLASGSGSSSSALATEVNQVATATSGNQ